MKNNKKEIGPLIVSSVVFIAIVFMIISPITRMFWNKGYRYCMTMLDGYENGHSNYTNEAINACTEKMTGVAQITDPDIADKISQLKDRISTLEYKSR